MSTLTTTTHTSTSRTVSPTLTDAATQRTDSRPLTSTEIAASPFGELGARRATLRALAQMGIDTPTLIQSRAIPPLMAGRDVVGQSRTGSGKTIAFGLPLVERIDPRVRQLQALVLVPTRELATQVADVLAGLDGGRGLRVAQLIGGRSLLPQRDALMAGAQIAVGAPGRVLDHLRQGNLDPKGLRIVVLDEADQMLDAGFAPDVERILAATPPTRQMALFTATLPEWTTRIAQRYLHDPVRVDAGSPESRPAQTVAQLVYMVPQGQRLNALIALLDRRRDAEGTTLVFGRTKHGVKKLAKQLAAQGYPVAALQGNMSQNARDRVVADFRAGQVPVLLATNVAARGLDVLSIEQVINYELPESAELFTHRVGRTGRMDREGEAITLLTGEDMPAWQKIQRDLGLRLQPRPWPLGDMPLPELPAEALVAPSAPAPTPRPANGGRMGGGRDLGRWRSSRFGDGRR
ncbi:MAG: DEAD/DEAH box helicase [Ktedonobacterales bacterium]